MSKKLLQCSHTDSLPDIQIYLNEVEHEALVSELELPTNVTQFPFAALSRSSSKKKVFEASVHCHSLPFFSAPIRRLSELAVK